MFNNWIKIAFRSFQKNVFHTSINCIGLTIGMIGVILVSLYWKDELSFNQWNPNKEEIYSIAHEFNNSGKTEYSTVSTIPEGPLIKETFAEVEDYLPIGWLRNSVVVVNDQSTYLKDLLTVGENFFEFFPFEFIYGQPQNSLKDLQNIVISEEWMNELFGGKNPLGKNLIINQKEFQITGVYRIPGKSSITPKAVTAMNWNQKLSEEGSNWRTYQVGIFIKVKPQTNIVELQDKIYNQITLKNAIEPFAAQQKISVEEYKERFHTSYVLLEQLSTFRLFSQGSGIGGSEKGNLTLLYMLTGLTILIMILSAFNYINLATASSIKRAKEVGVRKTLGATKLKIIAQFILESFLICTFALLLALALTELILPYFNEYFEKDLRLNFGLIFKNLLLILVVTTIISGMVPALYLSKFEPLIVLKGNFSKSSKGIWIRNIMLGLQFVVSMFFLIAGIIIYLQVQFMVQKDLGFNGDQIISVQFAQYGTSDKYPLIQQEFKKIQGVKDVSSGLMTPAFSSHVGGGIKVPKTGKTIDLALVGAMDYNYIDLLGLEIIEGRNISPNYASDTVSHILINETLAKQLDLKNPIGEEIEFHVADQKFKIIGIIKDYFVQNFTSQIEPVVYHHWNTVSWTKNQMNHILLKVDSQNLDKTLSEIEKKWLTEIENKGTPFTYQFIDEAFANTYKEYTRQKNMFGLMTFIAILIAMMGLFGLISLVFEQRMKEISIRKVLGANPKNLIFHFGKEYLFISVISFFICAPLTYFLMQKWLDDFAYRIEIPIWPFIVGISILLILVFSIIYIRTIYTMKVNPVKYINYE